MSILSSLDPRNWDLGDMIPSKEDLQPWWWQKPRPVKWVQEHPAETLIGVGCVTAAVALASAAISIGHDPRWLPRAIEAGEQLNEQYERIMNQ